jgi:NAD(P)H-nitrite reductase large subunit
VTESTIIEAIRAGCTSLTDIRLHTYASTGCAGCAEEVKKLLKKYANQAPANPNDPKVSNG